MTDRIRKVNVIKGWALKYRSENRLDGKTQYLMTQPVSSEHGTLVAVYETRALAREALTRRWGYLRTRPDLKAEPHGWRMPKIVKVKIEISEDQENAP